MTPEQIRAFVLEELQNLDGDQLATALSSGVLDFSELKILHDGWEFFGNGHSAAQQHSRNLTMR